MNIHEKITKYRELKGLNKSQLAREINVSPAYITMIENGTKTPSNEFIIRLAFTLGVNPTELDSNFPVNKFENVLNTINSLKKKDNNNDIVDELIIKALKNYIEPNEYRSKLFNLYKNLAELNNDSIYYDFIDEKIVSVGLDNLKKILKNDDLELLILSTQILILIKNFINSENINDQLFYTNTLESILSYSRILNIPLDKNFYLNINITNKYDTKTKESNITPLPKKEKQIWEEEGKEYLMPKASHDKEGDFTEEDYKHDDDLMNDEDIWK
ncbi:helix-turn-helix domain-containing protein [Clostridium perfringens]